MEKKSKEEENSLLGFKQKRKKGDVGEKDLDQIIGKRKVDDPIWKTNNFQRIWKGKTLGINLGLVLQKRTGGRRGGGPGGYGTSREAKPPNRTKKESEGRGVRKKTTED